MRMRPLLLAGLVALLSISAQADVYKTQDKDGRVIYTDQPAASDTKAKVVELPSINQLPATEYIPQSEQVNEAAPPIRYQVIILSPSSGTRLMPDQRNLTVSISIDKSLRTGLSFAYTLNGNKFAETTELSFTLVEPPRGENKIQVQVVDKNGKIFGQSETVTVYVMRPIIKR